MRRIIMGTLVGGLISMTPIAAQGPDPAQWVLDHLQGVWSLQSQRINGQFSQGANPDQQFRIKGNRFYTQLAGRPGAVGTIRIVDPLSNPYKIDFVDDSGSGIVSLVQIQGDTMVYCGADNGLRPTDLGTRPGDGRTVSTWRRVARR